LSLAALALAPAAAQAAEPAQRVAKKESTSIVKRPRVSRTYVSARPRSVVRLATAKPSYGQKAGLHSTQDDLDLKSSVALVIDQDTREVLLSKNDSAVLPIASITKLMTGLIVSESKLPMDEARHHQPGGRRHREVHRLAPEGGRHAHARRADAPGPDGPARTAPPTRWAAPIRGG
jgi:hypothetical protein